MTAVVPEPKIHIFFSGYCCKYLDHKHQCIIQFLMLYYHGYEGVVFITELMRPHSSGTDDCFAESIAKAMKQRIIGPIDITQYFNMESPTKKQFCQFMKEHYCVAYGDAIRTYRRFCADPECLEGEHKNTEYTPGFYGWRLSTQQQETSNTCKCTGNIFESKYDVLSFAECNVCIDENFMKLWKSHIAPTFNDEAMIYYWFDYIISLKICNGCSKQYINKTNGKFIVGIINYDLRDNDNEILYGIIVCDNKTFRLKSLMTKMEIERRFGINGYDLPEKMGQKSVNLH